MLLSLKLLKFGDLPVDLNSSQLVAQCELQLETFLDNCVSNSVNRSGLIEQVPVRLRICGTLQKYFFQFLKFYLRSLSKSAPVSTSHCSFSLNLVKQVSITKNFPNSSKTLIV